MEWTKNSKEQFRVIQIISFSLLVAAPIAYLVVANILHKPQQSGGEFEIMFYMLFFLGMVQPLILPLLEKFQISQFKNKPSLPKTGSENNNLSIANSQRSGTPMGLFMVMTIIKSAFVEAIFIYGFVIYFISGDMMKMLYFYPVGLAWAIVHFPTKERCERFIKKVNSNAIIG